MLLALCVSLWALAVTHRGFSNSEAHLKTPFQLQKLLSHTLMHIVLSVRNNSVRQARQGSQITKKTRELQKVTKPKLYETQVFRLKPGAHYITSICAMVWKWSKRRPSAHHSGLGISLQGVIPTYPHIPDCLLTLFGCPAPIPSEALPSPIGDSLLEQLKEAPTLSFHR